MFCATFNFLRMKISGGITMLVFDGAQHAARFNRGDSLKKNLLKNAGWEECV